MKHIGILAPEVWEIIEHVEEAGMKAQRLKVVTAAFEGAFDQELPDVNPEAIRNRLTELNYLFSMTRDLIDDLANTIAAAEKASTMAR